MAEQEKETAKETDISLIMTPFDIKAGDLQACNDLKVLLNLEEYKKYLKRHKTPKHFFENKVRRFHRRLVFCWKKGLPLPQDDWDYHKKYPQVENLEANVWEQKPYEWKQKFAVRQIIDWNQPLKAVKKKYIKRNVQFIC